MSNVSTVPWVKNRKTMSWGEWLFSDCLPCFFVRTFLMITATGLALGVALSWAVLVKIAVLAYLLASTISNALPQTMTTEVWEKR